MRAGERMRLAVGISPCPNDTFAWAALLEGALELPGLELEFELADVEELNERAARAPSAPGAPRASGSLDVCKVSAAAALNLAPAWTALPAGAALGFGVGPLVLAPPHGRRARAAGPPQVLLPGAHTTAALLWRLFRPEPAAIEHAVFSAIMPRLARGEADLGVCIHEGRFTYAEHGLVLVEDLGATWERASQAALPLGLVAARSELGPSIHRQLARALGASIEWARAHPDAALATMRRHAQEHSDAVLMRHVELYVNDWTVELGGAGRAALALLDALARERGLVARDAARLAVAEA